MKKMFLAIALCLGATNCYADTCSDVVQYVEGYSIGNDINHDFSHEQMIKLCEITVKGRENDVTLAELDAGLVRSVKNGIKKHGYKYKDIYLANYEVSKLITTISYKNVEAN